MYRKLAVVMFLLLLIPVGFFVYIQSVSKLNADGYVWKKVDIPNVLLAKKRAFDVLVEINQWANSKALLDYQGEKMFAELNAIPAGDVSLTMKLKSALIAAKLAKQNKEYDLQMAAICNTIEAVYSDLSVKERYAFILTLEQIDYCFNEKYSLCSTLISINKQPVSKENKRL